MTTTLKRPGDEEPLDGEVLLHEKKMKVQSQDHSAGSEPVSTIEIIPTQNFTKFKQKGYKAAGADKKRETDGVDI